MNKKYKISLGILLLGCLGTFLLLGLIIKGHQKENNEKSQALDFIATEELVLNDNVVDVTGGLSNVLGEVSTGIYALSDNIYKGVYLWEQSKNASTVKFPNTDNILDGKVKNNILITTEVADNASEETMIVKYDFTLGERKVIKKYQGDILLGNFDFSSNVITFLLQEHNDLGEYKYAIYTYDPKENSPQEIYKSGYSEMVFSPPAIKNGEVYFSEDTYSDEIIILSELFVVGKNKKLELLSKDLVYPAFDENGSLLVRENIFTHETNILKLLGKYETSSDIKGEIEKNNFQNIVVNEDLPQVNLFYVGGSDDNYYFTGSDGNSYHVENKKITNINKEFFKNNSEVAGVIKVYKGKIFYSCVYDLKKRILFKE